MDSNRSIDDPACDYLDRQYMLGDSLLVAPVFSPDGTVDYYLPEGRWTNFLTGQIVEGGHWMHETHSYLSLPLTARPNAVIPVGANEQRPDYDYASGVTFHVFELQDGATLSARVRATNGDVAMKVEVSREGQQVRIDSEGPSESWAVLLRGVGSVQSVEGGTAQAHVLGTLLVPVEGARCMIVRLSPDQRGDLDGQGNLRDTDQFYLRSTRATSSITEAIPRIE